MSDETGRNSPRFQFNELRILDGALCFIVGMIAGITLQQLLGICK